MKRQEPEKADVYVLTQNHMGKIEELISELQSVYCDIFSNRHLKVTSGLEITPASALINAVIENKRDFDEIISG